MLKRIPITFQVIVTFALATIGLFSLFHSTALAEPIHNKIKVGFVIPLTGPAADYGVAVKNAVELGMQEIQGASDHIEIILDDAQYDFKLAASSFNRLRSVVKADVIVVWGLAQCRVVAPIAELYKTPMIALCLAKDVAKSRKFVLRFQSSVDEYMRTTAEWLGKQGKHKIGSLVADSPYTEEMYRAFERQRLDSQSLVLLDRVSITSNDFYSQVTKVRRSGVDALGVFLGVGQIGTFAKQLRGQSNGAQIFGTNIFGSRSELVVAEGGLAGSYYADIELAPAFKERYTNRFGNDAQLGFGALAYEILRVLTKVAADYRKEESRPITILDAMVNAGEVASEIVGTYKIKEDQEEGKHVRFPLQMIPVSQ